MNEMLKMLPTQLSSLLVSSQLPGHSFDIQLDVSSQNLIKSQSRYFSSSNNQITLRSDRPLSSSPAEMPIRFPSSWTRINMHLAGSKLCKVLHQDVLLEAGRSGLWPSMLPNEPWEIPVFEIHIFLWDTSHKIILSTYHSWLDCILLEAVFVW